MTDAPILRVDDVYAAYGDARALHGVTFEVGRGTIVGLLGANGAGKSTTLRVISGMLRATAGTIEYAGEPVGASAPSELARRRLIHVPEGRHLFGDLSVEENLAMGAYTRSRQSAKAAVQEGFGYFPRLQERRRQRASTLSGGEQQMLALARAFIGQPELLLIDEASLGLAPRIVREVYDVIREFSRSRGVSVLCVEQNTEVALDVTDAVYVIETGRIVWSGAPGDLGDQTTLAQSYLGYGGLGE